MALAQAMLTPVDSPGDAIRVLFNPTKYGLEEGNQIAELGVPGLGAPVLQYVRGNASTMSVELFFDTYEPRQVGGQTVTDVRTFTDRIYGLLEIESSSHVPPVCDFTWGTFSFRCIVEHVSGQFTLFLEDGTPVRATLTVALKEFVPPDIQVLLDATESADHVKTRAVARGDTLASIAAAEYGDPASWRPIARENGIANPRRISPGQLLVIPKLTGGST
jgi:nucleoid-associated protein YgaU